MVNLNFLKRTTSQKQLLFFQLDYNLDTTFGVTAASAKEAEEIVCEEIFHNQTIPGFPEIKELSLHEVKKQFKGVALKKVKQKGIWFPG
jgi:hypothetical protein